MPAMPLPVRAALALLVLALVHSVYGSVKDLLALREMMQMPNLPGGGSMGAVIAASAAFGIVIPLVLTAGLALRRNWARIGWLVLTLFALGSLFVTQRTLDRAPSQVLESNAALVLQIVAVYLLFATRGGGWFRRDEATHA
jgi:hypothetical protein